MTDPLSYLFGLEHFGIKFGLHNMAAIVERLGHPERAFRSVHVAGTNGKGSVTAMVEAALRAAGHRSARYTSPHMVDLCERFVIDGSPVTTDTLRTAVADVRTVVEALRQEGVLHSHPTFFEVTTAVAFELFRRAQVEVAVLEVGLGGRLDSTNVVTPEVSVITSIALDHEQYLGSTLGQIAFEKAGIIKPGVPVVVGAVGPEAMAAIARVARDLGATVIPAAPHEARNRHVGLPGTHQVANAAVAVRVLEALDARGTAVSASAIAAGLRDPKWPGRLDLRRLPDGREMLLDAAHNPAGAAALASYLREQSMDALPLVFAVMRDKDIDGILRELAGTTGYIVLTRATMSRSADPDVLARHVRAIAPGLRTTVAPSVAAGLDAAWGDSRRIVVAGSIFLLGDVLTATGEA